jgi:hypothetical protein
MTGVQFLAGLSLVAGVPLIATAPRAQLQATTNDDSTSYHVLVDRQLNRGLHTLREVRLLVSPALGRNQNRLKEVSQSLCGPDACTFYVWDSDERAPHTNSRLTRAQIVSQVARISASISIGAQIECYRYGGPVEPC